MCSTRNGVFTGSRRAGRCRCRRAASTGTCSASSATRLRTPSCPRSAPVRVARRTGRRDGHPAGANRARRLLPGRDDELRARAGRGTTPPGRPDRAQRVLSQGRRARVRPRPAASALAIGHGTLDPVIGVEWGRQAKELLEGAGADVLYREYPLPHTVDPSFLAELRPWLEQSIPSAR